ncbi:MAG TPA: glycosyltransferase [Bacteroidetes bacterium]|nr:glycosyltransferase [Bacteroidota bacterium]
MRQARFDEVDILLLENFRLWPLLEMVKAQIKVYHMRDDFSGYRIWHNCSDLIEREIIRKVDKVIVTAHNLKKRAKAMGAKEVFYLPNGVDFNHFAEYSTTGVPEELKKIPPPRIIYVGAISEYFDLNLLEYCARLLPDCSFILIGPSWVDLSGLKLYKNIHVLGAKDYDLIPAYLRNCNVGIIPFKKSRLTESACPIKLFEYMASGLPVVCTNLAEIRQLGSPAFLAENEREFVSMIKSALELSEEEKKAFTEFARQNTWEQRYQQLKSILGIK